MSPQRLKTWIPAVLTGVALCAASAPPADAAEPASAAASERRVAPGDPVRSFYCRAVTGPQMNRSVCYVCRNGDRPVVMLLARDFAPGAERLFRGVDRLVDEHRAGGLRSFGVLLRDEAAPSVPVVQTFAFDHYIEMPLAIAPAAVVAAVRGENEVDAAVTVVLYRRQRVAAVLPIPVNDLTAERVDSLLEKIGAFAAEADAAGPSGE